MHAGIWPAFEKKVIEETQDFITWRDERGITKRDRRDGLSMPDFLDYPVKCRRDWEALKAERLALDAPGRIEQDWDAFRARLASEGLAVRVGDYPFGVFGTPRDLLGAEELLVAFYDEPDMIRDMMDHLTTPLAARLGAGRPARADRPDPHLGGHVRQAGLADLARDGRATS